VTIPLPPFRGRNRSAPYPLSAVDLVAAARLSRIDRRADYDSLAYPAKDDDGCAAFAVEHLHNVFNGGRWILVPGLSLGADFFPLWRRPPTWFRCLRKRQCKSKSSQSGQRFPSTSGEPVEAKFCESASRQNLRQPS